MKKHKDDRSWFKVHHDMVQCPNWRKLSLPARAAYIEVAALNYGSNNGEIAMSARRLGELLGCHHTTSSKLLVELENGGFIETTFMATFKNKRRASEYRLTAFPGSDGRPASNRFLTTREEHSASDGAGPQEPGHFYQEFVGSYDPPLQERLQPTQERLEPTHRSVGTPLLKKAYQLVSGPGWGSEGSEPEPPGGQQALSAGRSGRVH